jgi:hypothetical protein
MVIAACVISLLAILLAPILLIRFRKRWVAAFQFGGYEPDHWPIRRPIAGLLHSDPRRSKVRKSGRLHRTPVNVFRVPEGFLIALTYGRESQWVRNAVAAGACQLKTRGVSYQLSSPTIVHDPTRRRFPLPVRIVLGLIGASDFMQLSTARAQG